MKTTFKKKTQKLEYEGSSIKLKKNSNNASMIEGDLKFPHKICCRISLDCVTSK